ncbi:MAG: hypothetical protein ACLFTT_05395 [Candidatus Hydrogenedentota bacterium]
MERHRRLRPAKTGGQGITLTDAYDLWHMHHEHSHDGRLNGRVCIVRKVLVPAHAPGNEPA